MKPQEAIPILERLQEPEAWEPQISRDAYEALELAIEALEKLKRYETEEKPEVKSEIICDPDCDGFVCSQNGIYGWCPKMERWGCEYFYELERRNDG